MHTFLKHIKEYLDFVVEDPLLLIIKQKIDNLVEGYEKDLWINLNVINIESESFFHYAMIIDTEFIIYSI